MEIGAFSPKLRGIFVGEHLYGSYAWIKLGKVQDCGEVPRKVPEIFS